jgi:hypothetical protein
VPVPKQKHQVKKRPRGVAGAKIPTAFVALDETAVITIQTFYESYVAHILKAVPEHANKISTLIKTVPELGITYSSSSSSAAGGDDVIPVGLDGIIPLLNQETVYRQRPNNKTDPSGQLQRSAIQWITAVIDAINTCDALHIASSRLDLNRPHTIPPYFMCREQDVAAAAAATADDRKGEAARVCHWHKKCGRCGISMTQVRKRGQKRGYGYIFCECTELRFCVRCWVVEWLIRVNKIREEILGQSNSTASTADVPVLTTECLDMISCLWCGRPWSLYSLSMVVPV